MTYAEWAKKWEVRPQAGNVGDGWALILEELSQTLHRVEGWHGQVYQIKEKFGGLRFYAPLVCDEARAAVRRAEKRSEETCETCGKPGRLRCTEHGWWFTACDECTAGRK